MSYVTVSNKFKVHLSHKLGNGLKVEKTTFEAIKTVICSKETN